VVCPLASWSGPCALRALEGRGRIIDLAEQEIAIPFADTAACSALYGSLDDGAESWVVRRLQSVTDLDALICLVIWNLSAALIVP
jgi:hypothetical protein